MHGKFAAAKVSTFVVSDFCVVWDFDCRRLCITPQMRGFFGDALGTAGKIFFYYTYAGGGREKDRLKIHPGVFA